MKKILPLLSLLGAVAPLQHAAHAAEKLSTYDSEQLELQQDLSWLTLLMWGLVFALIVFAFAIRYIARRRTAPCNWCMEFINKSETVCPRCGKKVFRAEV